MASFNQVMNMGPGISSYRPTAPPTSRAPTPTGGPPTAMSSLMGATPSGVPQMPGGMGGGGGPMGGPPPDPFGQEPGPFPQAGPFPRLTMQELVRLMQMRERYGDPELAPGAIL